MLSIRSLAHNSRPRYLIPLFIVLLQCVKAQTSTATWLYPTTGTVTINNIDTIILEWTSNYEEAWLLMWCQIDGPGPNVSLGPKFQVQPNGSFPYIIFSQYPAQQVFPVACHAQLAVSPSGAGVDSPVGITFTSSTNVPAKTFSLAQRQEVSSSPKASSSTSATTTAASLPSTTSSISRSRISTADSVDTSQTRPTTISRVSQTGAQVSPTPSSPAILPAPAPTPDQVPPASTGVPPLTLGLSVGLSIAIIALLSIILFIFLRRRRRAKGLDQDSSPDTRKASRFRFSTRYGDPRYGRHELEDEPRRLHEMEAREREKAEMDGAERQREVAELEARRKSGWTVKTKGRSEERESERWKKRSIYELP